MQIGGFEPFSLCDFPGKPSAVVFTQGCNFKCPYCHNKQLIRHKSAKECSIDSESILKYLKRRQRQLDGIVVSGGEPCLQSGLFSFLKRTKELGFALKLDTNGSYPGELRKLIDANLLDFIAMDIKAPLAIYDKLAGISCNTDAIKESIEIISKSGCAYQFRTTWDKRYLTEEHLAEIRGYITEEAEYKIQECILDL